MSRDGVVVTGVTAGVAGTAAMTATARLHRLAVARHRGLRPAELTETLDYDDSDHVVVAAARVVRALTGRAPATPRGRRALFWCTHWGYGTVVGATYAALRRTPGREPTAGLVLFAVCEAVALGLFPVLGGTPVPWRWPPRLLVTSVVQHAVYTAGVAGAHAVAAGRVRRRR